MYQDRILQKIDINSFDQVDLIIKNIYSILEFQLLIDVKFKQQKLTGIVRSDNKENKYIIINDWQNQEYQISNSILPSYEDYSCNLYKCQNIMNKTGLLIRVIRNNKTLGFSLLQLYNGEFRNIFRQINCSLIFEIDMQLNLIFYVINTTNIVSNIPESQNYLKIQFLNQKNNTNFCLLPFSYQEIIDISSQDNSNKLFILLQIKDSFGNSGNSIEFYLLDKIQILKRLEGGECEKMIISNVQIDFIDQQLSDDLIQLTNHKHLKGVIINQEQINYFYVNTIITWNHKKQYSNVTNYLGFQIRDFAINSDAQQIILCTSQGLIYDQIGFLDDKQNNSSSKQEEKSQQTQIDTIFIIFFLLGLVFIVTVLFFIFRKNRQNFIQDLQQQLINNQSDNQDSFKGLEITQEKFQIRYKLIQQIGQGGQSNVYLYKDNRTSDNFAVKTLFYKDDEEKQIILQEVKITLQVQNHQHIVQLKNIVFDNVKENGTIHIVMELADDSLNGLIKKYQTQKQLFDDELILQFTYQLVNELYELQQQSIVHRDIKPSNILVFLVQNKIKLSDFGCSKSILNQFNQKEINISDLSRSFTIVGTQSFLSPQARSIFELYQNNEQTQIKEWDVFKNDVFALGLTILCLCTVKQANDKWNLNEFSLNNEIENIEKRLIYSDTLITVLKSMLIWNEQSRPSISIIKNFLDKNLDQKHRYTQQQQLNEFDIQDKKSIN